MNLYIIAGPNGAGKTTFAKEFLPHYVHCNNFINADLIAQGLSPLAPELSSMKAARILLEQIQDFSQKRMDFAFETTLSGKTYLSLLKDLKKKGYSVHLFFLWVPSVDLALARIRERVSKGGHNVPVQDVRRRFRRSINNLFQFYRPLLNSWVLFDNSMEIPRPIAEEKYGELVISDKNLFSKIYQKEL